MPKVADTKKAPAKKTAPKEKAAKQSTKEAAEPKAPRTPREPKDLTPNMVKVLEALRSGEVMTATEITEATEIEKGRRLPELVEKGYITEMIPEEGKRGKRFKITATGRKALDKALKEQA